MNLYLADKISLLSSENSLFGKNNSLFGCAGNLNRKADGTVII